MIIDEENNSVFLFDKLNNLKNDLNKDKLDLRRIQNEINQISKIDKEEHYEYMKDLLDPIKRKGVKIPSNKLIPSCSFQLHNSFNFASNASGMDLFYLNPFFLANDKALDKLNLSIQGQEYGCYLHPALGVGTYFANVETDELGVNPLPKNWYFPKQSVYQCVPNVYTKYRVVSACMTLQYIGPLESVQGIMGGAIVYKKTRSLGIRYNRTAQENVGVAGSRCVELAEFANIETIRDSFYHQENYCLEGLKMIYFPLDNSFEDFKKVFDGKGARSYITNNGTQDYYQIEIPNDSIKDGFGWVVYMQGVNAVGANFKLDYYINYECLPDPSFLNYIPISINLYTLSEQMKSKIIEEVQKNAIKKLNNK